jgi:SAM-dependent methyltransferase
VVAASAGIPKRSRVTSAPDSNDLAPLRRFSDRVEDYVRHRPGYPHGVIGLLSERAGLSGASTVADVGSGTGIFTRLLLGTGARVFAVEPNDAMRSRAEEEFRACANFVSVPGSAEATGLGDRSVSLVTCAQAFHWFDAESARREFARILAPGGWCALIWNTPLAEGTDFAVGYERIKVEFGTDFQRVRHENIGKAGRFDAFFGAGGWKRERLENSQTLDYEGLKGRLLSSSYAPNAGHPRHGAMLAALQELFDRCRRGGVVRMDYTTEVFLGRPAQSPKVQN